MSARDITSEAEGGPDFFRKSLSIGGESLDPPAFFHNRSHVVERYAVVSEWELEKR